ncbi:MAG: tetratricopeptide repeat protein [Thaumarchaeota archaeon]|nr:tetratricopeptide repeat protein [Nitrososphaerota archaeon]MDD9825298.1 tetratricopeptide repeat protein [Nitrososphaerota archaeon]
MKWYEAILAVAIAMWAYDRIRERLASRRAPKDPSEDPEVSFVRNTLPAHEQAVIEYPDMADSHFGLARALTKLGRHDEALEAFGRAAELDPGSYADYWSGLVNLRMGKSGEALGFLDRSVAHHPDDADVHCLRGRALAGIAEGLDPEGARGHYEMAAGALGRALRLDPGHADAAAALDRVRRRLAAGGAEDAEPGPGAELAPAEGGAAGKG